MSFPKGTKLGPQSAEHRAKLSAANLGKQQSAETRAKISAAMLTKNLGKTRSAETLIRMSNASTKHGHSVPSGRTPTYRTWESMIQRCTNPQRTDWKHYGGRGITICSRWNVPLGSGRKNVGFQNFVSDMGIRPARMTIDRKDNALGYFKENCRWATPKEQTQNRRLQTKAA